MAIKKEIEIRAKFDTSDFDKSVEQMQKKLKEIYAPADMIRAQTMTQQRLQGQGLGNISQPSMDAYNRATQQSRREMDQMIREQVTGQEKLGKLIAQREAKVKELVAEQNKLTKGSQEELALKEKIARVEENIHRQRQMYLQRDQAINLAMTAREKSLGGAHSDYSKTPKDFAEAMDNFGRPRFPNLGMYGRIAGGVGMALKYGGELYRDLSGMPMRTDTAVGNAMQGTMGRDVNNIYGRRTAFEMNFSQERARAAQNALDMGAANRTADKLGLAGNSLMVGGGLASGLATSWTGVGGIAGLAVAGKGAWNMISDERQRSLMLSPFSSRSRDRYQSLIAEQMAQDYQGNLEAQKNQNPFKTAAVSDYEQNFMRNLGMQRMMGLGNQGFYGDGGFMRQSINAGFTPEMAMEMAQSIQGAGGSTRMMRDSTFGNQLARGADLTNAGQILGTLSGGLGSSESTKQAAIKIGAEATRLGLDESKFAEEQRKFAQVTAEFIARSGGSTSGDMERILSSFGGFYADKSTRGLDAAKNAYEEYQQISSSVTGPRGVMRAAGFLRDEKLSQLDTVSKQALLQIPEEQLTEDNPLVAGLARKVGETPKDFIQRIKGINQGAVSRFKEADQIRDRLRERGVDMTQIDNPEYMQRQDPSVQNDVTSLLAFQTMELGYKDSRTMKARAAGTVGRQSIGDDAEAAFKAKLESDTGRMEDNTVRAQAGDASTVLKNFNEMRDGMDAAAKSAAAFTDKIREMNAALIKALEEARNGDSGTQIDLITRVLKQNASQLQTQAGKTQ